MDFMSMLREVTQKYSWLFLVVEPLRSWYSPAGDVLPLCRSTIPSLFASLLVMRPLKKHLFFYMSFLTLIYWSDGLLVLSVSVSGPR